MTLRQAVNVLEMLREAIEAGFVRPLDRDARATTILELTPAALDAALRALAGSAAKAW